MWFIIPWCRMFPRGRLRRCTARKNLPARGLPRGPMSQRWKTFAWAAALFYLVLLSFTWSALTRRADLQTESMLDFAMLDFFGLLLGRLFFLFLFGLGLGLDGA